jgi:ABC-2 type transporter
LSSTEWPWRLYSIVRTGAIEYRAANPPLLLFTTTMPRAILQCVFFVLVARRAGLDGGFAFIGALTSVITVSTVVQVCDVPMLDKFAATYPRLQRGVVPPWLTFVLRSLPMAAEALVAVALCLAIAGPALGQGGTSLRVLAACPLVLLIVLSSTAAGLTAATSAVGRRADVLVGNTFSYLILTVSGALVPPARLGVFGPVGAMLPIRHGLAALRATIAGQPWHAQAMQEAAVGAGWLAVAILAYRRQSRRARLAGTDDFA